MAGAARQRGIIAGINVTPLVDIMLVLLIVFMLTAHLIAKQAIEVKLPPATQGSTPPPSALAVTLTREGRLYLNGAPITPTALRAALRAAIARDPASQVAVAGDKDVAFGRVVWVLDTAKELGVTSFPIQIDPKALIAPSGSE